MTLRRRFAEFVKRHTSPIEEDKAHFWKRRISVLYAIVAWNAFGLVVYMIFKGKSDWMISHKSEDDIKMTPAQQWATTLNIKDAKVLRISGFNVSKYEIHRDVDGSNATDNTVKE